MTDAIDPLHDPALFVRPPAERTPAALVGTIAGDVHAQLVRWLDGPDHHDRRQRIERFLDTLSADELGATARAVAAGTPDPDGASYDVPLAVMAAAVGVADADLARAVPLARAAARGMGPGATGDPAEAIAAIPELLELVPGDELLDAPNRIGLLLQTCDAVAALVAATLERGVAAATIAEAQRSVIATLGDDPPVRVARRFGSDGELVTVDISDRSFGAGPHRCPGESLAIGLAAGTVAGMTSRAR